MTMNEEQAEIDLSAMREIIEKQAKEIEFLKEGIREAKSHVEYRKQFTAMDAMSEIASQWLKKWGEV